MKVNCSVQHQVQIVEVEGDLDFHSSPNLRQALNQLADKKSPKIVIQLKKVGYMDSSGIATFVEALQKTKKYQGKLVLAEMAPAVRSVFEIAKLDGIFVLSDSLADAMQKVGA